MTDLRKLLNALDEFVNTVGVARAAEILGVEGSTVHRWLHNERKPRRANLKRMAGGDGRLPAEISRHAFSILRSRGEPFRSDEERRKLYTHVALLLEACDFPCEVLKGSVFTKAGWDAEDNAAVTDLIATYVDARYFADVAACAGNDMPLPVHPFDRYTLAAFLEPASVEALKERIAESADADPEFAKAVLDCFGLGRGARAIFEQKFLNVNGLMAVVKQVMSAAETESVLLFDQLYQATRFRYAECPITEPALVVAGAATAALRAELAVMCAAHAFRVAWHADPSLGTRPLYRIASKILDLCCVTYPRSAAEMGRAMKGLQDHANAERYKADLEMMLGLQNNTAAAVSSDEGMWFCFTAANRDYLAFLTKASSLLHARREDDEGVGPVCHRFRLTDEAAPPSEFVEGTDIFAL